MGWGESLIKTVKTGEKKDNVPCDKVRKAPLEDAHSSQNRDKSVVAASKDPAIAVIPPQQKLETVPKKSRCKVNKKKQGSKENGSAGRVKKSKDPVRMYLKEIGAVSLLSREGEVEIAKRIEQGQKTVLKALSRSPVVVDGLLRFREALRKGELGVKNLVNFIEEELTQEILEIAAKRSCSASMKFPNWKRKSLKFEVNWPRPKRIVSRQENATGSWPVIA